MERKPGRSYRTVRGLRNRLGLIDDLDFHVVQAPAFTGQVLASENQIEVWGGMVERKGQVINGVTTGKAKGVGFGASGRNGGWCMGLAYGIQEMLADPAQRDAGRALLVAMHDTVDEVGRVSQRENIDCHYAKGGTLRVAGTPHHIGVLKAGVARMRELGFTEDDYRWLPPAESMERIGITPNLGASYTPHCAAIHPARLVHGLAATVRAQGVAIFEGTPVHGYAPKRIEYAYRGDQRVV